MGRPLAVRLKVSVEAVKEGWRAPGGRVEYRAMSCLRP